MYRLFYNYVYIHCILLSYSGNHSFCKSDRFFTVYLIYLIEQDFYFYRSIKVSRAVGSLYFLSESDWCQYDPSPGHFHTPYKSPHEPSRSVRGSETRDQLDESHSRLTAVHGKHIYIHIVIHCSKQCLL